MLSGNEINVLIVDDDEDDFLILSEYINLIEGISFKIDWCNEYTAALEKIAGNQYHIYFVDYRLGSHTGLDLLAAASNLPSHAPIILLTGKGNHMIDIEAMRKGATDYLIKSELNTEKIERCIRYSLDRANSFKALLSSETKYRNLFESSKDALFIADKTLQFREVNSAACELLGCLENKILSDNLFSFIQVEEEKQSIKKLIGEGKNIPEIEIEIKDNSNIIKWCILSISLQTNADGDEFFHGILHDITNLKNAEKLNIQAQKLDANERLVRILAHEIRNPLNNILVSADHLKLPNEKEKGLISIIQRNSTRINQIITELLDSTRKVELVFEKQNIRDIIEESLSTATDRISLLKIKLNKLYQEEHGMISADSSKLKIAFTNVIINAIEAMEPDKGELTIAIASNNGSVVVSVTDNGKGIPKEYLSKLFEPFFTLKKNGMGLGLSSAYLIIRSHKGTMEVQSTENSGTTFVMNFPAA